jgi:mRNA interferase MazF
MVPSAAGAVVLVPFPFSDLTQAVLRPAVALADVGRGDWILCQVTSNAYGDPLAESLNSSDFQVGSLHRASFARPGKLFTANHRVITAAAGVLSVEAMRRIGEAVIRIIEQILP